MTYTCGINTNYNMKVALEIVCIVKVDEQNRCNDECEALFKSLLISMKMITFKFLNKITNRQIHGIHGVSFSDV